MVDYRTAPEVDFASRRHAVIHPQGWTSVAAGLTLRIDPPTSKQKGSWMLADNGAMHEANSKYHAELFYQRHYGKGNLGLFQKRYSVPELQGDVYMSLAELKAYLKAQFPNRSVTLSSAVRRVDGRNQQTELTIGSAIADEITLDVTDPAVVYVGESWYLYSVPEDESTRLIICPICDWTHQARTEELGSYSRCPNCHFDNGMLG